MSTMSPIRLVRILLLFFIIILFLSGVTAIPIDMELSFLLQYFSPDTQMYQWLHKVLMSYREVKEKHLFLLYGYDWLAFAHFVLAILFIGPYRDPVKNIWVIEFGMIACVLIIPLAMIAGPLRGIPVGWRLIDCSFGVLGFVPLWICYVKTKQISNNH
jgi:hypothetical protein